MQTILHFAPTLLIAGLLLFMARRGAQGGGGAGGGIFGVGKSKAKMFRQEEDVSMRFADVAGMDEAKEVSHTADGLVNMSRCLTRCLTLHLTGNHGVCEVLRRTQPSTRSLEPRFLEERSCPAPRVPVRLCSPRPPLERPACPSCPYLVPNCRDVRRCRSFASEGPLRHRQEARSMHHLCGRDRRHRKGSWQGWWLRRQRRAGEHRAESAACRDGRFQHQGARCRSRRYQPTRRPGPGTHASRSFRSSHIAIDPNPTVYSGRKQYFKVHHRTAHPQSGSVHGPDC